MHTFSDVKKVTRRSSPPVASVPAFCTDSPVIFQTKKLVDYDEDTVSERPGELEDEYGRQ